MFNTKGSQAIIKQTKYLNDSFKESHEYAVEHGASFDKMFKMAGR